MKKRYRQLSTPQQSILHNTLSVLPYSQKEIKVFLDEGNPEFSFGHENDFKFTNRFEFNLFISKLNG